MRISAVPIYNCRVIGAVDDDIIRWAASRDHMHVARYLT